MHCLTWWAVLYLISDTQNRPSCRRRGEIGAVLVKWTNLIEAQAHRQKIDAYQHHLRAGAPADICTDRYLFRCVDVKQYKAAVDLAPIVPFWAKRFRGVLKNNTGSMIRPIVDDILRVIISIVISHCYNNRPDRVNVYMSDIGVNIRSWVHVFWFNLLYHILSLWNEHEVELPI